MMQKLSTRFAVFTVGVVLLETGALMTLLNARPDAPLGFWLWFGSIAVLGPIWTAWRLLVVPAQRKENFER